MAVPAPGSNVPCRLRRSHVQPGLIRTDHRPVLRPCTWAVRMKPNLLARRGRLPTCDWLGQSTCYIEGVVGNALPIPPGFEELNVDDQIEYVQALWDRTPVLLDLRPAEVSAAGHIPGAVHLNLFGVSLIDTDPGPKPEA